MFHDRILKINTITSVYSLEFHSKGKKINSRLIVNFFHDIKEFIKIVYTKCIHVYIYMKKDTAEEIRIPIKLIFKLSLSLFVVFFHLAGSTMRER